MGSYGNTHLFLGGETDVRACTVRVRVFANALASVIRKRRALALPSQCSRMTSEERSKCGRDGRSTSDSTRGGRSWLAGARLSIIGKQ